MPELAPSTEAGQLSAALNHMLDRLDGSFALQAASEDRLRRFVADASHELRTPITTIRGYAELYRVGGLTGGNDLDEAMRRTEQEAVRMARLVDDLLTLAQLDQGRPLDRRPVDLAELAADAARDARAVDAARRITTDLPPDAGVAVVDGDEDRLRQVIANIVATPSCTPRRAQRSRSRSTPPWTWRASRWSTTDRACRRTSPPRSPSASLAPTRRGPAIAAVPDWACRSPTPPSSPTGSIAVDSAESTGTTVTVTLPVTHPRHRGDLGQRRAGAGHGCHDTGDRRHHAE